MGLVEIPDSYTFVSLDQPDVIAREIAAFATNSTSGSPDTSTTLKISLINMAVKRRLTTRRLSSHY